jgi:chemotaxis-related protein WspD
MTPDSGPRAFPIAGQPPPAIRTIPPPDCWRTIGVSGDRSCAELETFIHCRNCPVLAEAARTFFDRPAPDGYLENWTAILDAPEAPATTAATSMLLFRLGQEWFALPAEVLVEVTSLRPLHRIPHRGAGVLEGLVNIRGQLRLCVSLRGILGLADLRATASGGDGTPEPPARLLVVESHAGAAEIWVFAVDQVAGVQRVERGALRSVPSTVSQSAARYSQTLFDWQGQAVGVLDDERLFADLRGMMAS